VDHRAHGEYPRRWVDRVADGDGVEGTRALWSPRVANLVKLGLVLHEYSGLYYNVIQEKPNVGFSFWRSPMLAVPFFE
jgi:hypothetical protein